MYGFSIVWSDNVYQIQIYLYWVVHDKHKNYFVIVRRGEVLYVYIIANINIIICEKDGTHQ